MFKVSDQGAYLRAWIRQAKWMTENNPKAAEYWYKPRSDKEKHFMRVKAELGYPEAIIRKGVLWVRTVGSWPGFTNYGRIVPEN